MRIDHDTADRVLVGKTSTGRRQRLGRSGQQTHREEHGSSRRLLRALHDHAAKFATWSPTPRDRPVVRRHITTARRDELVDGLSAAAGVGRVAGARGTAAAPFRLFHEIWRQYLSEETYRWPEHDETYSFFLYAVYEDRGFAMVGLHDATTLVLTPGLATARVLQRGCATCGRPAMPDLTPWLRPAADEAFCCAACERRTVTPREVWEIGEGLAAVWTKERDLRVTTKTLPLYEPVTVDWFADYGPVLALGGVDALATVSAQLQAGPLVGIVVLVDGTAFVQTLRPHGAAEWEHVGRAALRSAVRRTPFSRDTSDRDR